MCYCQTGSADLTKNIEEAKEKISSLQKAIEEASESFSQTKANIKSDKGARADAKNAMAEAKALREKEAATFAQDSADYKTNIAALDKAIPAIEQGMAGAFLQTRAASSLRTFAMEKADIPDETRQEILSFLSGEDTDAYAPQSGEIVGILKQLKDEMMKDLASITATEDAAIAQYNQLMAAKKKEVAALTKHIEVDLIRAGEGEVSIASMKNDLEDTEEALKADETFLTQLEAGCDKKAAEWKETKKMRAEELLAVAETIKFLNDDDALELFKKTLPGSAASFLQVQVSSQSMRKRALSALRAVKSSANVDFIALAIDGKSDFTKVIGMIDEMVVNLNREQKDDDDKRDYCNAQFDEADDAKKELEQQLKDHDAAVDVLKGSIEKLTEEIAMLEAAVKETDRSVAEATEMRKKENSEYKDRMQSDQSAKELLKYAKNRLNKFYNPKLYNEAPKRELSESESITVGMGGTLAPTNPPAGIAGTGISASVVQVAAHNEAPYKKQTGQSAGVISMIDLLVRDLDTDMQKADVIEKDSQADYEKLMEDAGLKRAEDSKSITEKTAAKAGQEEALQGELDAKTGTTKALMMKLKYIQSLHGECDWLLKNFDVRKEARASEIDALGKAKAVLSGADFSFLQVSQTTRGFLAA